MTLPTLAEPRHDVTYSNGKRGHDDGGCDGYGCLGFALQRRRR
jgi:hypothetical protein